MHINSTFIYGLFAIITPALFLLLLISTGMLTKLSQNKKQLRMNTLIFCSAIVVTFHLMLVYVSNSSNTIIGVASYPYDLITFHLLLIGFSIWTLANKNAKNKLITNVIRITGISLLGTGIALSSLTMAGPLIASNLMASADEKTSPTLNLTPFSLGLIIPFFLVLWLISLKIEVLNTKKWWSVLQIFLISLFMLSSIIRLIQLGAV